MHFFAKAVSSGQALVKESCLAGNLGMKFTSRTQTLDCVGACEVMFRNGLSLLTDTTDTFIHHLHNIIGQDLFCLKSTELCSCLNYI